VGIGDHGGAGIESEALTLPEIGAPAGLVAGFDQRRGHARGLQPDRQREAAETRADHAGALAGEGIFLPGLDLAAHAAFRSARGAPSPPRAASARPTGTGGLPQRIRSRSSEVDWAP